MQRHNINNTQSSNTSMGLKSQSFFYLFNLYMESLHKLSALLFFLLMLNNHPTITQGGCLYSFSLLEDETV